MALLPGVDIVDDGLGAALDFAGLGVNDGRQAGDGLDQTLADFEPVRLLLSGLVRLVAQGNDAPL